MGYNVSAAGTTVVVNGTNITDFADDVSPVTVSDVEVGNGEKSFSGAMLVWGVEKSVKIEISVIPDSQSDYELYNLAKEEKSSIDTDHSYTGFSIVIKQNGHHTPRFINSFQATIVTAVEPRFGAAFLVGGQQPQHVDRQPQERDRHAG